MHPALTAFHEHRATQQAERIAAHGRELARYATDPEAYELECQAEDERQSAEHEAATHNDAY